MKIAVINGSPKIKNGTSSFLLQKIESMISSENEIFHYNINKNPLTAQQYRELCSMDTLLFAFPLYIDAIPSHLFRMLAALEDYMKTERQNPIYVYAIINNGFYEGRQNHIAISILQNWCLRTGLQFGRGIGLGAGEMMNFIEKVPLGHGPQKNLGNALRQLADSINSRSTGEVMYISPNFPRFAWKFNGTHFFWNATAKTNGLKKKDILKRL
ncbi:Multimeric flavodoxin WrbA [Anaerocolumna jejuensis DSM 15929]|uniref:Multimeric flavodoxin WrbA n=1 Tax=Anaerocolumna jejuensis DSM 15929 TaxID=1121322 RepID=A0A1M7BIX1_9FIRM|nr:hypothetical protein [Anaerocolumna jejuensis]SHL54985.1 Multimeric flavodoxin WrbA [Anaerocolumna jejuensis DSM 15929]